MTKVPSRLENILEKQSKKQATLLIGASVLFLILLLVLGIPLVFSIANFVSGINRKNTQYTESKITPSIPRFSQDVLATTSAIFKIVGASDPNINVEISVNGRIAETVISSDNGLFSLEIDLEKGENIVTAVAISDKGVKSNPSEPYTISRLWEKPKLEITSLPENTKDSPIEIKGSTSGSNSVYVNDRLAIVDSKGNFSIFVNLNSGENKIKVTARDPAGNSIDKEIKVTYSP